MTLVIERGLYSASDRGDYMEHGLEQHDSICKLVWTPVHTALPAVKLGVVKQCTTHFHFNPLGLLR